MPQQEAMLCPCGSGEALEECCRPILDGRAAAETAEACLRSRYTAFVLGEIDHVLATHHSSTREDVSRESVEEWSSGSEWLGLEVVDVQGGGPDDGEGQIRFHARYRQKGNTFDHAEVATFKREDGLWRFVDAVTPPFRSPERKVGRNEPCPCGSGKKYKKCCGA